MKVKIRPLRMADAESVQWYASDELVARTTNIIHPYPKDGGESFVKNALEGWENRKHFQFAIIANNKMVGVIGFKHNVYVKGRTFTRSAKSSRWTLNRLIRSV